MLGAGATVPETRRVKRRVNEAIFLCSGQSLRCRLRMVSIVWLLPVLVASRLTPTPPPPPSPFAKCGWDETGVEMPGSGELNLPFGMNPWCCGNTTWSSFSWRAMASPNTPFNVAAVAAGTPAAELEPTHPASPNTTACIKKGGMFDCFTFAFNTSDKAQGTGFSAHFRTELCT
jgi:hypothetical protein